MRGWDHKENHNLRGTKMSISLFIYYFKSRFPLIWALKINPSGKIAMRLGWKGSCSQRKREWVGPNWVGRSVKLNLLNQVQTGCTTFL